MWCAGHGPGAVRHGAAGVVHARAVHARPAAAAVLARAGPALPLLRLPARRRYRGNYCPELAAMKAASAARPVTWITS